MSSGCVWGSTVDSVNSNKTEFLSFMLGLHRSLFPLNN